MHIVAVSTRFPEVFTVGWIHWLLLGQALASCLETQCMSVMHCKASEPTPYVCCGVPSPAFPSIQLISVLVLWQLLCWAPLSEKCDTCSSRVPENIRIEEVMQEDVTVGLNQLVLGIYCRNPQIAGCLVSCYSQRREMRNTEMFWMSSWRQDKACPTSASLQQAHWQSEQFKYSPHYVGVTDRWDDPIFPM